MTSKTVWAQAHADDVKVALVGKIASFVTWPPEAGLDDPKTPFRMAVIGSAPMADKLVRGYHLGQMAGHEVRVRRLTDIKAARNAHLVFLCGGAPGDVESTLRALAHTPVLTMADSPGFAHRGVAVNLVVQVQRVAFEINRKALAAHGLSASYRLLALAKVIP